MIRTFFIRLLQRSDFVRFLAIPLLFIAFAFAVSGIVMLANRKPSVESISPAIAGPGEVIVLKGRHFGETMGDNWIEIAGDRISGNACIQWTDTTVMITLPETVADGLVYVCSRNGKSNPLVFANRNNIPVAARVSTDVGQPVITSFNTDRTSTGKVLTISGRNFGITRSSSEVRFTWQISSSIPIAATQQNNNPTIACSEHDFDYEFWSDQELRVRVPDGATTGNVYVKTDRGLSNQMPITIVTEAGTKQYRNQRTYLLSLEVDITGVSASEGNMLFLRIPVPQENAMQHNVEVTASNPKPYMENYQGTILHQLENLKNGRDEKISHSFLLTNYGIETKVTPALVKPYEDVKAPLYLMYTAPDAIVPSDKQEIILASASIVQKEKNPYLKARLLYAWLAENVSFKRAEDPNRSPIEALESKSGDAYDLAILFTALARASGIPAVPAAGILVDAERSSRVHWWAEFYIENFGWIPVDPGLAAETGNAERYFASMDNDHIAFSRGWIEQKAMTPKSRIVYKPRSFAFQPVWEESGGNIKSYASFWGDPKVTGVY